MGVQEDIEALRIAKESGEPTQLEKVAKITHADILGLPKPQADLLGGPFGDAEAPLKHWFSLDTGLLGAIAERDKETLRTTIGAAREGGLKNESLANAEELHRTLEEEAKRKVEEERKKKEEEEKRKMGEQRKIAEEEERKKAEEQKQAAEERRKKEEEEREQKRRQKEKQ